MKLNFATLLVSLSLLCGTAAFTDGLAQAAFTALLHRRWRVIGGEVLILATSFLVLTSLHREPLFPFAPRLVTYVNSYLAASDLVDRSSILDVLGERGVPVVVALTYYPTFASIAREVFLNLRYRGLRFSPTKLVLPLLVFTVKVAEELEAAYAVKLYGNFRRGQLKFGEFDFVIIVLSVGISCLSLVALK
ncbi:hypothetical protein HS1genome_2206 [Sulfodiicoccus acidiphilus]|uniref:Uncharacterized protein n=1 Tax=Sulfodiicoccus acidiphilus TaxID=1670455 RepID=A0A348B6L5_9CREN|nr:hypothetical protein [Sulfodiicoccus acidiphilus]BBD73817.1 hypothetical protein HS1genome_2206 [Sulfodiicoccus acidiphilus]GGT96527.1 hypothetical protein GCM10007116_12670 [Sulfodiicoccus acidiphilus]